MNLDWSLGVYHPDFAKLMNLNRLQKLEIVFKQALIQRPVATRYSVVLTRKAA